MNNRPALPLSSEELSQAMTAVSQILTASDLEHGAQVVATLAALAGHAEAVYRLRPPDLASPAALLTRQQVASALGIPVSSVGELLRRRALPEVRIGKHSRVRASDLGRFLEPRQNPGDRGRAQSAEPHTVEKPASQPSAHLVRVRRRSGRREQEGQVAVAVAAMPTVDDPGSRRALLRRLRMTDRTEP